MKVTCKQCKKVFEAKRSDAKYCAPKCRQRAKRQTPEERTCIICGKTFATKGKALYCSDSCSEIARVQDQMHSTYKRKEIYWDETGEFEM